jgi:translocation and assembly module TamA
MSFTFFLFAGPLLAAEPVEVVVEGVEGAARDNVRTALALPEGLVREGKADRLWLKRFAHQAESAVRSALEPYGYYNARVNVALETVGTEGYRLRVRVEAGTPVLVEGVKVELRGPGTDEKSLRELAAAFPLHRGDVLLQPRYEEAKEGLRSRAVERGYLDAEFAQHEILIAPGATTATINLVMETGEQYRFGEVRVEGAPDYPEPFLRRYLTFKPDERFTFARLAETQLNYTNSERFKEVIVTPEKEEARDLRVPVLVQLKQAPRRRLRPGAGYGTDTGARFSLRYRDLDMFQRGHELSGNLYVSERLQGLVVGYTVPSSRDIRGSTSLQLNLQRQDVTTYTSQLVAVEADLNRGLGKGALGTAYLKLQQEEFTIGSQHSNARLVLPGLRLALNRYDNQIRPHRGYRLGLDLRGTHQALGSDTGLIQVVPEGSALLPLPWRLSLHLRGKGGITFPSEALADIPASLRFFAGGDQSVRGYAYQSLGPRDAGGKVVGGRHLVVGSAELERALFKDWGVSLFYDAGNAFNSFTNVSLFQGAGVGVHYYTPIGALNLSLARQIGVDTPAYHVHVTVGFEL